MREYSKFPLTDVVVKLKNTNANVFNLISLTRDALRKGGHNNLIEAFTAEAMSRDYDHAIRTIMRYCHVE